MSAEPAVVRPARLMVVIYGVWAGVLAVAGPQAEVLPSAPQTVAGLLVAAACIIAAIHPDHFLRLACVSVAGYAMWSTARVVADESYATATTIAGATTYVTMAASALATEAMTAILQGVDEAAKDLRGDE